MSLCHFQPMEKIDQNGENFRYNVGYRRTDEGGDFMEVVITDWRQSECLESSGK